MAQLQIRLATMAYTIPWFALIKFDPTYFMCILIVPVVDGLAESLYANSIIMPV